MASPAPTVVTALTPRPEPELDFSVDVLGLEDATVVRLTGEADLAATADLGATIERALGRARPLVVDLCAVTFIDSSGLSAVLRARSMTGMRGLPFAVSCVPGGPAARLFGLVGLNEALALHASPDDALRTLRVTA